MAERGTPAHLLVGHSWGGAAAIAAAAEATGVRAVATIGAPADPSHVERQYDAVMERVLREGSHEWFVGGRTLVLKRAFVDDVHQARLRDRIRELHLPLLVTHSPPTTPSASPTPGRSSVRRGTREASSRSRERTIS
jgi:putative redox protein